MTIQTYNLFIISMAGIRSSQTIEWYVSKLKPFILKFSDKPIQEFTISDLRAYRAYIAAHSKSVYTLINKLKAVKKLFNFAMEENIISTNPAARLEIPTSPHTPPKGITLKQLQAIVAATETPREKAIILFFAETGCRLGGLLGLRVCDIDFDTCRTIVTEKGRSGGKSRFVYFTSLTQNALLTYLNGRNGASAVFISEHTGEPLTRAGVHHIFVKLSKKLGFNIHPHAFRHGVARALIADGMPLPKVSQLLGHSSIRVTADIYGTYSPEDIQIDHARHIWTKYIT